MSNVVFTIIGGALNSITVCKRGTVAAETSLLLPLLTAMILGVFEFGSVVYAYSAMQLGANRVARTVAVNRMTNAQANTEVRDYIPLWARDDVSVSVTQSNPNDTNINLVNVQLAVTSEEAALLPMLTRMVPWQLTVNVAMKQELPYVD